MNVKITELNLLSFVGTVVDRLINVMPTYRIKGNCLEGCSWLEYQCKFEILINRKFNDYLEALFGI